MMAAPKRSREESDDEAPPNAKRAKVEEEEEGEEGAMRLPSDNKIHSKLMDVFGFGTNGDRLAKSIMFEAKIFSKMSAKQYMERMRDLLFNLKKNKKLMEDVKNGDLEITKLVQLSNAELASDDVMNERRKREQISLDEHVLTENIDALKRESYRMEQSKVLNFEHIDDDDVTSKPEPKAERIAFALIWKGRVYHNEPVLENEQRNQRMFGIKIYQLIGAGDGDQNALRFQSQSQSQTDSMTMTMTKKMKHSDLERYTLKLLRNNNVIYCKITISRRLKAAQKFVRFLGAIQRCGCFKIGDSDSFHFYIIPPTKNSTYLNPSFVLKHFKFKITNKQIWGIIVPRNSKQKTKEKPETDAIPKNKDVGHMLDDLANYLKQTNDD